MKARIRGMVCGGLGLMLIASVVWLFTLALRDHPAPEAGASLVALVHHYGLRDEILLGCLGVALLPAAGAMLLSPRRRWVAMSAERPGVTAADVTAADVTAAEKACREELAESADASAGPRLVCYLRTHLMGSVFRNPDGSSRQEALGQVSAGDVLVCRAPGGRTAHTSAETVGVFTVSGCCLGFLDAAFLGSLRDRYPGCRIGVEVESVSGGGNLPYTCDLRVAVYRM